MEKSFPAGLRARLAAFALAAAACAGLFAAQSGPARAEYGDVVINNYSDAAGVRPGGLPALVPPGALPLQGLPQPTWGSSSRRAATTSTW